MRIDLSDVPIEKQVQSYWWTVLDLRLTLARGEDAEPDFVDLRELSEETTHGRLRTTILHDMRRLTARNEGMTAC